jgi:ankyrin repeat protein
MDYKTTLVIITLVFLSFSCGSNQNNKDRNINQAAVNDKSVQGLPDNRLHQASLDGNKQEVMRLLEEGMDINSRDMDGRTALMYASFNGHTDIVNELLKKGAKVNMRDNYGRTPLMFASSGPFPETVKLLLENGADPDLVDGEDHYTAIMYAAAEGQLEVIKVLLAGEADPTLKDVDGDDAVTFALNNGHKEAADLIESFINRQNYPERGEKH